MVTNELLTPCNESGVCPMDRSENKEQCQRYQRILAKTGFAGALEVQPCAYEATEHVGELVLEGVL